MRNYLFIVSIFAVACGGSGSSSRGLHDEPLCSDVCRETNGESGIAVCHVPPGNLENPQSLCVGAPSVNHHLSHHDHDYCGVCETVAPPDAGIVEVPDAAVVEPDAAVVTEPDANVPAPDANVPTNECQTPCNSGECANGFTCVEDCCVDGPTSEQLIN